MVKKFLLLAVPAFIVLTIGEATGIARGEVRSLHPLSALPPAHSTMARDSFHVVALLVDFAEDNDGLTSGNGTFNLSLPAAGRDAFIDGPPHNPAYFKRHLEFLKNYIEKTSRAAARVGFTVIPTVVHLPAHMSDYANGTSRLATLALDAWKALDETQPDLGLRNYDPDRTMFTIFHAGVGHDVDFNNFIDYDPRPHNLPSMFFSLEAMKREFGSSFRGISVDSGRALVTNCAILPETLVDTIEQAGQIAIGMNGLLAATFGSFLGLPDLHDTKTGRSGIGEFGLMDFRSYIFADNGAFPPEPSAWEKVSLGWIAPVEVTSGTATLRVKTPNYNDSTIIKIPISSREYYLVENRRRDALNDGTTLTVEAFDGTRYEVQLSSGNSLRNNTQLVRGVLVAADEYDDALPGENTQSKNGGILIWHVDEDIIDNGRAANTVNADVTRKGVELIEADGVFNIGHVIKSALGNPWQIDFIRQGDYWYSGDNHLTATPDGDTASYFKNRFDAHSVPPAITSSGLPARIAFSNFSKRSDVMSFTVHLGDDNVSLLPGFPKHLSQGAHGSSPVALTFHDGALKRSIIAVSDGGTIRAWDETGKSFLTTRNDSSGTFATIAGINEACSVTPIITMMDGKPVLVSTCENNDSTETIVGWRLRDNDNDGFADTVFTLDIPTRKNTLRKPQLLATENFIVVVVDTSVAFIRKENRALSIAHLDGRLLSSIAMAGRDTIVVAQIDAISAGSDAGAVRAFACSTSKELWNVELPDVSPFSLVVAERSSGGKEIIVSGRGTAAYRLKTDGNIISSFTNSSYPFSAGDVNRDGFADLLFIDGQGAQAVNATFAHVDNFPVAFAHDVNFPTPQVLTFDSTVIALARKSDITVIRVTDGIISPKYTISYKATASSTPAIIPDPVNGSLLSVIRDDSLLYIYKMSLGATSPFWNQYGGNSEHTSEVLATASTHSIAGFLPEDKVYTYPNPVHDGNVTFHVYASENATIDVVITNFAGERVGSFSFEATGSFDNEYRRDLSRFETGTYHAYVTAHGVSGKDATVMVKIAVVK